MSASGPLSVKTVEKGLDVLDVLLRNFAQGYTPKELADATGLTPPDVTRYVNALVNKGFAERFDDGRRIRPSHRFGQFAVQILNSLETQKRRAEESLARLAKGI